MALQSTGHVCASVFSIGKLALTHTSKATWGYATQMSTRCFKGGQSDCQWSERMDKKPLGCHRA